MFNSKTPQPQEKQTISLLQFKNRLNEEYKNNPTASIDTIVNNVKDGFDPPKSNVEQGSEVAPPVNRLQAALKQHWWKPLLVLLGVAAAVVLWILLRPGPPPGPTPTSPSTLALVFPAEIRFGAASPTTASPGQEVPFTVELYDTGGNRLPGVPIMARVEPPDGGLLSPDPANLTTGTGGEVQLFFQAGNTSQPVNIIVETIGESPISRTHTLTVAAAPSLSAKFKDPAPTTPLKAGNPFIVTFQVDNTGQVTAGNVSLTVDTPAGLVLEHADTGCNLTANGVTCAFVDVHAGQNGSKSLTYRADQAGTPTFAPESYRLSYNGAMGEINGSEPRTYTIEEPRAAGLNLTASLAELAADGTMSATLDFTLTDQWDGPYAGPAFIATSVRRAGGALSTPPELPLTLSCIANAEITFVGEPVDEGKPSVTIPANTQLRVTAYNQDEDQLYVNATLTGQEHEGWVARMAGDTTTEVRCSGSYAELPATPPIDTPPDGLTTPDLVNTATGTQSFTYQAGTVPGEVIVVAQLVDGTNKPIGEPAQLPVTLLMVRTLNGTPHLYDSHETALANDANGAGILINRLPQGTPLALHPQPDDGTSDAYRALASVWVPSELVITENGAAVLNIQTPLPVTVGSTPDTENINSNTDNQRLQPLANGRPVQILETADGLTRVLMEVWVRAVDLQPTESQS